MFTLSNQFSNITLYVLICKQLTQHKNVIFRIQFTVSAINGGQILYENRSTIDQYVLDTYNLKGFTTTETLDIRFDMFPPKHCFESDSICKKDALQTKDFVNEVHILGQLENNLNVMTKYLLQKVNKNVFFLTKLLKVT